MNEIIISEEFVPFPQCSSMERVELMEWCIFQLAPGLTTFTREVTAVERAAGIIEPHALVMKMPDGITRKYGTTIADLGDLQ